MRWDSSTRLWGQCVGGGLSRVTLYEIHTQENINSLQPKPPLNEMHTSPQHLSPGINAEENVSMTLHAVSSYETMDESDTSKHLSALQLAFTDPLTNSSEESPLKLIPSFKILAHRISDRTVGCFHYFYHSYIHI